MQRDWFRCTSCKRGGMVCVTGDCTNLAAWDKFSESGESFCVHDQHCRKHSYGVDSELTRYCSLQARKTESVVTSTRKNRTLTSDEEAARAARAERMAIAAEARRDALSEPTDVCPMYYSTQPTTRLRALFSLFLLSVLNCQNCSTTSTVRILMNYHTFFKKNCCLFTTHILFLIFCSCGKPIAACTCIVLSASGILGAALAISAAETAFRLRLKDIQFEKVF